MVHQHNASKYGQREQPDRTAQRARINDVAAAAGVSVSTVSNVLNNPNRVLPETRDVVSAAMRDLEYVPNEHAVALRRKDHRASSERSQHIQQDLNASPDVAQQPWHDESSVDSGEWGKLREGDRVEIVRAGRVGGLAVIDAIMPDRSAVWLWMANGMGRSMVLAAEDVVLRVIPAGS